ncbi:hypothetical protein N7461_000804 [Penicillium sp. DV-2018c]|nr:hypothetical protein N7461_000804 [Penicillium sp. DV-2018c]
MSTPTSTSKRSAAQALQPIEYQKRSLPHCHLPLFLANADQFHNSAMINTFPNEHGYPLYDRPDNPAMASTKCVKDRDVRVDDHNVVAHSPYLIMRYRRHINVEVVKYITKYAYKGPDQATVQLTLTHEIQGYLEGGYVGPSEAIRRLLKYRTHEEYPPVYLLIVHLPGRQPVRYPAEPSGAAL